MRRFAALSLAVTAVLGSALIAATSGCGSRTVFVGDFPAMLRPADLVSASPPYGDTRESPPIDVVLEFARPITKDCKISVWLDDRQVDAGDGGVMLGSDNKLQVSVESSSGEGLYRVEYAVHWRGGGADDGRYYFRVKRMTK